MPLIPLRNPRGTCTRPLEVHPVGRALSKAITVTGFSFIFHPHTHTHTHTHTSTNVHHHARTYPCLLSLSFRPNKASPSRHTAQLAAAIVLAGLSMFLSSAYHLALPAESLAARGVPKEPYITHQKPLLPLSLSLSLSIILSLFLSSSSLPLSLYLSLSFFNILTLFFLLFFSVSL